MTEALETQLAGHSHVRVLELNSGVWRWYGNQQATSQCRGIGDGFRSRRLGLPQVTDRKEKLSCSFCPSEPTDSKIVLSAGLPVRKSYYSWERPPSWKGTGHVMRGGQSSHENQQTGIKGTGSAGGQSFGTGFPFVLGTGRVVREGDSLLWKESTWILWLVLLCKWQDIKRQDWVTFFSPCLFLYHLWGQVSPR